MVGEGEEAFAPIGHKSRQGRFPLPGLAMRSLQEIVAVPPSRSPQAIFYDGGNGKRERIVSFPSSILWFINSSDPRNIVKKMVTGRMGFYMDRLWLVRTLAPECKTSRSSAKAGNHKAFRSSPFPSSVTERGFFLYNLPGM